MAQKYYARRPFGYGAESRELDRGQILELEGMRNDEALTRLAYAEKLPKGIVAHECGKCGGKFIDEASRNAHFNKRHPQEARTPEEEDRLLDQEERYLEQVAPLRLENSKASRGVNTRARSI